MNRKLIREAEEFERRAQVLRQRARWGDDLYVGIVAHALIAKWCADPDMWATHRLPSEHKLERMALDIVAAIRSTNLNRT